MKHIYRGDIAHFYKRKYDEYSLLLVIPELLQSNQ
jgi:hypothetical protein